MEYEQPAMAQWLEMISMHSGPAGVHNSKMKVFEFCCSRSKFCRQMSAKPNVKTELRLILCIKRY